ncbi:hypothetical protein [Flavobacterium sp.]|uniref:hypothetical protein n=1 Tax=Flavobacterium sp. TaxID=239 RepID=UPI002BF6DDFF|nr:hypothetical protein [Flavobacterium sp.]HSD08727.1 hypothetical protein [Flavobacterium sp.]
MKAPRKSPRSKIVLVSVSILTLLSSGILYYINREENKSVRITATASDQKKINKNELEKMAILNELNGLKKSYDAIILENKTISIEFLQERDKVMELMADLESVKGDQNTLITYRNQVNSLHDKLKKVAVENEQLKKQNTIIKKQRDIAEVVLKESQKQSEILKQDLVNTVEKSSKLSVSGTTVIAYKLKTSGELTITDRANKVDGINISFVITKNEMAKPIDKVYYIQVVNSENTVLGDINEGVHQYKSLTYSLASNVSYQKKTIHVSENLLGNKFSKGTYYVNVYDKEELVDESYFILK